MNIWAYTQLKEIPSLIENLWRLANSSSRLSSTIKQAEAQVFILSHGILWASRPDQIAIEAWISDLQTAILSAKNILRIQEILDRNAKKQSELRRFIFESSL